MNNHLKDRKLHERLMKALVNASPRAYTAESRKDGAEVYELVPDVGGPRRELVCDVVVQEDFENFEVESDVIRYTLIERGKKTFPIYRMSFNFHPYYPVMKRNPITEAARKAVSEYEHAEVLADGGAIIFINKNPEVVSSF